MWRFDKKKLNNMKLFEERIYPIYKDLYRFILCIARNETLAEDALQNTLLKAYRSMSTLKEIDKFKSWIFTIAKNETISLIKKYRRDTALVYDFVDSEVENTDLLPDELMINNELRESIVEIINCLKPEYKDIILLRYYSDLSLTEIADILGCNINTIKTRHKRAKEKIAAIIKEKHLNRNGKYTGLMQGGVIDV